MHVTLYLLRDRGRPRAESDWRNAPVGNGSLLLSGKQISGFSYTHLTFQPDGTSRHDHTIGLHDPRLIALGHGRMRWIGFELLGTAGEAPAVVQEWVAEMVRLLNASS
ncbi:MAG: hypothetical protein JO218_12490 [Burkholderiales bacterium]|nr:hypothetical protein [Burkholderiales bacterium]